MLDRLSLLAPDWTERSPADVGDRARRAARLRRRRALVPPGRRSRPRRTSPPRAAGRRCAATPGSSTTSCTRARTRAPGCASSSTATASCSTRGTPLLTRVPERPGRDRAGRRATPRRASRPAPRRSRRWPTEVLFDRHERFDFWTWGDAGCCLPRGATSATLVGDHPELKAGDVLVLAEVAGPLTGNEADADPAKRVAVRLTHVSRRPTRPAAFRRPADERAGRRHRDRLGRGRRAAVPALHLGRGAAGASSSRRRGGTSCSPTTAARSPDEPLGEVPDPVARRRCRRLRSRASATAPRADPDPLPADAQPGPGDPGARRRRAVADGPVDRRSRLRSRRSPSSPSCTTGSTTAASGSPPARPSSAAATTSGRSATASPSRCCASRRDADGLARPAAAGGDARRRSARPPARRHARRDAARGTEPWTPQLDLLGSDGDAPEFVVEVEHDGAATLRFGDGEHGRRPDTGTGVRGDVPGRQRRRRQRRRGRDRPRRDRDGGGVDAGREPAAGRGRRRSGGGRRDPPRRARGVPLPAARRHRGRLRRGQRAHPACSARGRRSAGPARGTPSSSPRTRPAAARSTTAFETDLRATSSPSAWPATTSRSTRRASSRSRSRCTSASSRTTSART